MSHIYLVGFMGAGKSTVGRIVAAEIGAPFVDMDSRIEARDGRSVAEIFEQDGEPRFRELEAQVLSEIEIEAPSVVACGGGVILASENRAILKRSGTVVHMQVSAGQALARIGGQGTRPLLAGGGGTIAASLLEARKSAYASAADVTVDTEGKTRDEVAKAVLTALKEEGS